MSDYDTDFLTWTERQAELLRRRASGDLVNEADLDWLNIAEEIESVGASQKREVRSRLKRICQHLLKWRHQPERRSSSWEDTLFEQRSELADLFEESPSLRRFGEDVLPRSYVNGRRAAEHEVRQRFDLPDDVCPWSLEQILAIDFLPD